MFDGIQIPKKLAEVSAMNKNLHSFSFSFKCTFNLIFIYLHIYMFLFCSLFFEYLLLMLLFSVVAQCCKPVDVHTVHWRLD